MIDPNKFLFPLIQSWPTPSSSAESLVVRQEGNQVLFLNTLRHRQDPPLAITLPMDSPRLPAAWALKGHEGMMEGRDYRGVPVLAVTTAIPGTPWHMVTKIDMGEIYRPLYNEAKLIIAGVIALILLMGAAMGWVLTAQRKSHYKQLFHMTKERQALLAHFEYLVKYANDIILLVDENLKIVEVNDRACEAYGYSREELLSLHASELWAPNTLAEMPEMFRRLEQEKGLIYETVQRRKDTTLFPVEISNRIIEVSGRKYYQAIIRDITERKRAEETIRESEEKYRSLFEEAVEGVFQSTPEGRYLNVNPAMARMLGYATPQEMITAVEDIGSQLWVQPEKREEMKRLLSENDTLSNYEIEYQRPDGTSLWVSENIRLRNRADDQRFFEGFMVDITERKRAEESLLTEKVLSDTIINSLPGVFYCFDDQGRFLRWNRNFEQVSGYAGEEFAKLSPLDLFQGKDRELIDQAIREVFFKGENTAEADMLSKDGRKVPYFFTGRRIDLDGVPCLIGMGIDITERKQAEADIKLNEARLASLVKIGQYEYESIQDLLDMALSEAIALTGSKIGYIYFYDDKTRQFTLNTWSKEVMQECSIAESQTIYQLEKTGIWGEAVRQARPIMINDFQAPHPLKKGYPESHAQLYKYLTIPVFSGERIVAVVGVANKETDYDQADTRQLTLMMDAVWKIVARQRAEIELRFLNLQLELRVEERTAQLEAANRELESFTYSVSHDLRSPLRGIDGWSQALLEDYHGQLGEEGCLFLDRVRWETQRMGQLIDDLLALSRVGRAEMVRETVDLSALVRTIAVRLQETAPTRRVEFLIQPGLTATGDPRLLEIALFNLLDNAWKFTSKSPEAVIECGAERKEAKPVYYIRDNGAGFDMAYAQKLFGAFQRLHKITEFSGTGIGLATVQRIINRHGGRIWAEAAVDRGATFFFTL